MAEEQVTINIDVDDDGTIEAVPAIITQLQKTVDTTTYYAPFGADDKNITVYHPVTVTSAGVDDNIEWQKWGTLRNFFEEWLNFKKIWKKFTTNAHFIRYSTVTPTDNNVVVWFEVKNNDSE